MIIEKRINEGMVLHYSDIGYDLLQVETGDVYGEAYDIYPCPYTYEEILPEDDGIELSPEEVYDILMGIER